jgi:D-alanyl-D-alanine carboxypeptidase
VKQGQTIGSVIVTSGGQQIAKIPAVAGASVEKQGWWRAFWPF